MDDTGNPVTKFLLERDGKFTLPEFNRWVESYTHIDTRATQDYGMLFESTLKSLSTAGRMKIYTRYKKIHVDEMESGVLLLKIVLEEAGLKINAKIISVKLELANLTPVISQFSYNIIKFNSHVYATIQSLK